MTDWCMVMLSIFFSFIGRQSWYFRALMLPDSAIYHCVFYVLESVVTKKQEEQKNEFS